ncbi:MAG: tetratricopeptide repeat protein [Candidatus Acidiferrales bacterium]
MSRSKDLSKKRAKVRKSANSRELPRTGPFLSGKNLNVVLCVSLAIATVALYIPAVGHPFINFDDHDYVTANPHIHGGLAWSTIKWSFTSTEAANWHPLTWLSHALDYQLFALNPAGHHLDSVLIHTLNAVLLFLLLVWVTKRIQPSFLVAALFALHPINVESVAWVAERKNILSTLFFLLAIAAYVRYAQRPDWRRYVLVVALFAAGLMAKPMVITLPFVLLLLDYWPLDRTPLDKTQSVPASSNGIPRMAYSRLVLEKIPLLFLSAASAWITLKAQRGAEHTFGEFSFAVRVENAVVAYGLYLWKMLWPTRLAIYPHSVVALAAWQWILSALVLIGITAVVAVFRRRRYLVVGWCWFLGTLIPVIGLVQVGEFAMADRYAYVPLIGIFIMISWSLADLAEAKKVSTVWRAVPALCALVTLGCVAHRQMGYWDSDYDLWSHALAVSENPFTHNALGVLLMQPDSAITQRDVGNLDTEQERMDAARRHFERALEMDRPLIQQTSGAYLADMARTLNNLGNVDRLENRTDDARRHGERALEIYRQLAQQNPDAYARYVAATLNNLGSLDRLQGRMDEARRHSEEALNIHRQLAEQNPDKYMPNVAMTLIDLGRLDAIENRMDEARQNYEEALKIDRQLAAQSPAAYLPDLAMTLNDVGRLDEIQNRMDEARRLYEEGLNAYRQLAEHNPAVYLPDVAMTLNNLGRVDRLENRFEESRAHYQEALSLLQKLLQGDDKFARAVASVQASLEELEKNTPR